MSDVQQYCREKAAAEGSNLYYASLYESEENKQLIFPVFALHYELFDCLSVSPDPGVTRIKLHWWQEELARLANNMPRHPVSTALLNLKDHHPYLMEYINHHYASIESLLNPQPRRNLDEWKSHWYSALGGLWIVSERLTGGYYNDDRSEIIRNGGLIFSLEILQNFYHLAAKLPGFLPFDLMEKYKLDQNAIKQAGRQEDTCNMFADLLAPLPGELNSAYTQLKKPKIKPARYHLIANRLAYYLCREILTDNSRVMQHKLVITPLRKLLISWRTKIFY